ncbi:kelch-like [Perkinsus olseni]|uniref:Kelch-like n=1 Tax=Perkinsus olseni TaxID=32597 RepID=A0A7J6SMJ8_PEROL|nr:kelch-like [Perkinsus olseni]
MDRSYSSFQSGPSSRDRWDPNGDQIAELLMTASKCEDPKFCRIASIPSIIIPRYILPYLRYDRPVRNCIFACGGGTVRRGDRCYYSVSTVEVYDAYSKKWCGVSPMHEMRVDAAAMAVGDFLYVVGGYVSGPLGSRNCSEVYDPWNNRWEILDSCMRTSRSGHSLALVGGRYLYAIGGDSEGALISEVEVLDTQTNKWLQQPQPAMPRPLARSRVLEKDGLLYIVGGDLQTIGRLEFSDLIYILDTTVKPHAWSVLSVRLSTGRSGCAVAWLDESKSCIGVFGGYVIIDGASQAVATSEVLPLEGTHPVPLEDADVLGRVLPAVSARRIPEMPSPRAGCRAVTVGCRVMLVGGEKPVSHDTEMSGSERYSYSRPRSYRPTDRATLAELLDRVVDAYCYNIYADTLGNPDSPFYNSVDEMTRTAMVRADVCSHSVYTAPPSSKCRRAAAQPHLEQAKVAMQIRDVLHAMVVPDSLRLCYDAPLVFDTSKWDWVPAAAPLFQGRTAAALSLGSVFPSSYDCLPHCSSHSVVPSRKRSREESNPRTLPEKQVDV